MFDTLPFPNMTAKDADERSRQTVEYLFQLREELVFILESMVSGEYGKILSNASAAKEVEELVGSQGGLTVAEVINSAAFKSALAGSAQDLTFTVNFETGNLEYNKS